MPKTLANWRSQHSTTLANQWQPHSANSSVVSLEEKTMPALANRCKSLIPNPQVFYNNPTINLAYYHHQKITFRQCPTKKATNNVSPHIWNLLREKTLIFSHFLLTFSFFSGAMPIVFDSHSFEQWLSKINTSGLSFHDILCGSANGQIHYCVRNDKKQPTCPSCGLSFNCMAGLRDHLSATLPEKDLAYTIVSKHQKIREAPCAPLPVSKHRKTPENASDDCSLIIVDDQSSPLKENIKPECPTPPQVPQVNVRITPATLSGLQLMAHIKSDMIFDPPVPRHISSEHSSSLSPFHLFLNYSNNFLSFKKQDEPHTEHSPERGSMVIREDVSGNHSDCSGSSDAATVINQSCRCASATPEPELPPDTEVINLCDDTDECEIRCSMSDK